MAITLKKLSVGDNVKNNNGIAFKILTIAADATDFTPTPSLVYTLSNDGTYYIIGAGFTDLTTLENDTSGGTAGSGLDSTWTGGELYIPNKHNGKPVLAIAPRAFQDIPNITTCYIQEGITHIGHRAFQNNGSTYALESIELPKSLTCLGGANSRVFWHNYSLSSINTKNLTKLELNTFYDCISLKNVNALNVKTTGNNVFRGCIALINIDLPNVETVGDFCFYNCTSLKNIDLPKAKTLNTQVFQNCFSLESVHINNVVLFTHFLFYDCHSLKTIIISSKINRCVLEDINVFTGCYHILGSFNSTYNPNSDKDGYIYVFDEFLDWYKNYTNWSKFADQIKPLSELPQEYKDLYNIA